MTIDKSCSDRTGLDYGVYLLWIAVWAWCVFGFLGQTYDDVYLAYVYAKHIVAGQGFVFNVGEKVLGTPAPLFVALLVVFKLLLPAFDITQVGSLISGTGLALAGLAIYQIGRLYNQRMLGLFAGLLAVFNPYTVLTLGGETPLYLSFVLWAFYFYLSGCEYRAALLLGLALMNRSEAVVPIGVFLGALLLERRRLPWRQAAVIALTVLPWLIFAFVEFGTPLSSSFIAKVAQVTAGLPRYPTGLWRWSRDVIFANSPLLVAVLLLAIPGLAMLWRAGRGLQLIVAWAVLQTLFYAALPIPFYHWYGAQIGVCLAVLAALGAVEVPARIRAVGRTKGIGMATALVAAVLAICALGAGVKSARDYQLFIPKHPANLIYQKTGRWFAEHSEPGARIAYLEIGQIAYYADRYIIDTLGLVTPGVYRHVARLNWAWPFEHFKADYIIYNAGFRDWIDPVLQRPWFKRGFDEVARITEPGYPAPLIIYKRRPDLVYPAASEADILQADHDGTMGEIYGDKKIGQAFTAHDDNLCGVDLLFGTFARKNTGTLRIALLSESKETLSEHTIPLEDVANNAWRRVDFPPIAGSKGKTYVIRVESTGSSPGSAVTLWRSRRPNVLPDGRLYVDGKLERGALTFKAYSCEAG